MGLTKNQEVVKRIIEEMLKRDYSGEMDRGNDIEMGLKLLNTMLPPGRVYVISDLGRLAIDFCKHIERPMSKIMHPDQIRGLNGVHFVILHTGRRNEVQEANYLIIREAMYLCRDTVEWHIGEWRSK